MIIAFVKSNWAGFRQNLLNRRIKNHTLHLGKIDHARERSISILQKRYGYTKEKAAYELDKYYSKAWLG